MLYIWYPKNRTDLNTIHEENDIIEMGKFARVKEALKRGKHTEEWNTQEVIRFVEFYNRTVTRLLSRDCRTPTANVCQPWTNYLNNGNKYLIIGAVVSSEYSNI